MGLHSGEPARHEDGYIGLDVHRAARIAAAAHGGQVVLSEAARLLVGPRLPADVSVRDLGLHRLKDIEAPERIYQLVAPGLQEQFPPLKSLAAPVKSAPAGNLPLPVSSFADCARLAEQAAGIARAGGDLADACLALILATRGHMLAGDTPGAVPQAREVLALARQIGAPALVANSLLAVGAAVAETHPGQARACLRESRELSTALGYQSARDLFWATAIAFLLGDQAATLDLGCRAIRGLQRAGERFQMGIVFRFIAGALAATRPDAAAIIQGAAETCFAKEPPVFTRLITSGVTAARGADMGRDQALGYILAQATQALTEPEPQTRP
jgi:hypothetical protein